MGSVPSVPDFHDFHDTLITTGNGGSEPTAAQVTLFYNEAQGRYRVEKVLSPGQQLWLDIGQLIQNQIPDSDGHTLPPDAMTGSYELRDVDHQTVGLLYEGKLVIDKTFGHASYGCAACCGYNTTAMSPSSFIGAPGIYYQDVVQAFDGCSGVYDDVTSAAYSWTSANTSVATVSQSGNLHTVSVGSTSDNTFVQLQSDLVSHNCPEVTKNPTQPVNVPSLKCTSPVTRGQSSTCTVSGPSGITVSGWQFSDGTNSAVKSSSTSLTWSGTVVTSGTVSVTATVSGSTQLSQSITVNNRTNFAFTAVSPTSESNDFSGDGCTPLNVPSPPQKTGDAVGMFCLAQYYSFNTAQINDSGPNNGYSYVTSISNKDAQNNYTGYFYVISPDLENNSSTFYKAQCGNYNATAKTGFISGGDLLTDTTRHESGTVQSHYENYVGAQNAPASNLGAVAEHTTGLESASQLASSLSSTLNGNESTILAATQVEPCGVQYDASCNFQGCINFSPYYSCSGVVSCAP